MIGACDARHNIMDDEELQCFVEETDPMTHLLDIAAIEEDAVRNPGYKN